MTEYLFQDEFDGPEGAPPDSSKWTFEFGKWPYNNELETYNANPSSCHQDGNGNLVISANKGLSGRHHRQVYTSARIHTKGKFEASSGWFAARIALDRKTGTWPAFWMMGDNPAGWPWCGEIDIMESYGHLDWQPDSSVHTAGTAASPGANYSDATVTNPVPGGVDSEFHEYAIHHSPDNGVIEFFKDNEWYFSVSPSDLPHWPFCQAGRAGVPLYFILDMAVGGDGGGDPSHTQFPVSMKIDWVRAWK